MYPTSVHTGCCDDLGDVEQSLGDLAAGVTTVTIAEPYEDIVDALAAHESSIAIMRPDGSAPAWCGLAPP